MLSYSCRTDTPKPHPWDTRISDVACGYAERAYDRRCDGCRNQHRLSALEQLQELSAQYTEDGLADER